MQGLGQIRPVDPILTSFGLEYRQNQSRFAADLVAPFVQTAGDTGTYYIADPLNNLRNEDPAWGYNGKASRVDARFTSAAFKALKYGFETLVGDDDRRNWLGGGAQLDQRATSMLTDKLLLNREIRVEALCDGVSPTNVSMKWDQATSAPRYDVKLHNAIIAKRIGRDANVAVIPGVVWDLITGIQTAGTAGGLIIDAIKYTQRATGEVITPDLVAAYFGLERVGVASSIQSDATKYETTTVPGGAGLPEAGTYVWDKDEVYLMYSDFSPGPQTVSAFQTFGPTVLSVDRYREESTEADIIRAKSICVEKATCTTAISVLGDIIT